MCVYVHIHMQAPHVQVYSCKFCALVVYMYLHVYTSMLWWCTCMSRHTCHTYSCMFPHTHKWFLLVQIQEKDKTMYVIYIFIHIITHTTGGVARSNSGKGQEHVRRNREAVGRNFEAKVCMRAECVMYL
jgi:hypothetical protein